MRPFAVSLVLFLSAAALAQDKMPASAVNSPPSWLPRPVLYSGPSLLGGGYQPLAGKLGVGLLLNSRVFLGDFEANYMNARKTNDNTVNNRKGHERGLQGRLFYRVRRGIYVGGGAQWAETATTNYTKKAWRPAFGAGGDYFDERLSCRWQLLYITKGSDRSNGLQGPEFELWLPSPASRSHFFYRQKIGAYEYHTSVTDPTDRALTALQTSQRSRVVFVDFTVGWKF
jgi:hypothetical protein